MRDVCRSQDDVTHFGINRLVADSKPGPAFGNGKNLVVRMHMKGRPLAYHISDVTDQRDIRPDSLAFEEATQGLSRGLPVADRHFNGFLC